MNRFFIYASIFLAAVATGCKKDEPADEDTTPVSFEIEETVTRTVSEGNTTYFVEGDQIGITSSGLAEDMINARYVVSSGGTLAGDVFYYKGKNQANFYAHYPYTAQYENGAVTMTVSSDQGSAEAFNANDFMTATATGNPAIGGKVVLQFYHRLTLVKVVWNGSLTATAAELTNVLPTVTWLQSANSLTTSGTAKDIFMWQIEEGAQEFWALVPAQSIAAGTELLTIHDAEKTYKYVTQSKVNFNSNTIKKITLSVKADGSVEASINEIDIENWTSDSTDGGGDVEETETPALTIISQAAGSSITLTPNTKSTAQAGKWNAATNNGNTIEWDSQSSSIHMNIATGSWWDNAVYFRPDGLTAAKIRPRIFKLSFEVKASIAGKGFMVQIMKGDEETNTYFGIINSDPTGKENVKFNRMYYPSLKQDQVDNGEYVKMEYWVNFAQIISTDGKTITEGKVGDYSKVLLTLSINTGSSDANAYGVDFHFRNFEFVEVK